VSDHIEQMVFGWSDTNLTGNQGYGPLASSADPDCLRRWYQRLRDLLRSSGPDRPATSYCYVSFDGEAAVLQRSRGGRDPREDICHALVGPAANLTARLAIQLSRWPHWQRAADWSGSASLRPVEFYDLHAEAAMAESGLDTQVRTRSAELVPLLAAALRSPGTPLTVITGGDTDAVPLMWGLVEMMHHLEQHTANAPGSHGWTFSTHESEQKEGSHGLPHVVFMRHGPRFTPYGGSTRVTVRTTHELQSDDPAATVARLAVNEYVAGGVGQLTAWLAESGALANNDLRQRVELVASTELSGRGVAAPEYLPAAAGVPICAARAEEQPAPPPSGVDGPVRGGTRSGVRPATDPGGMSWLDLVHALGHAGHSDQIRRLAAELAARGQMLDVADRDRVRTVLVEHDFYVRRLTARISLPDVRDVVRVLINCAVGPDVADEQYNWSFLGDMRTSALVVQTVAEYATEHDVYDQLLPWFGLRWMREHGCPAPDPRPRANSRPVGRSRRGRLRSAAGDASADGDVARVLVVAGLLTLAVLVATGFIVWSL